MSDTGAPWQLGPFARQGAVVIGADAGLSFECPLSGGAVAWAAKDVFNPGAVVREGRVCLLVRAEDEVGRYAGTSRIGLAVSDDGLRFDLEPEPVLYPADDEWQAWEWPGGCEDPRLVESPEGHYVCLYTAFDGRVATLSVASSADLVHWEKHGPAFATTPYARHWSKSGSIVTEISGGRLVAARRDDRFWMYWGEGTCFGATSTDLVHWVPVEYDPSADRFVTFDSHAGTGRWSIHRLPGEKVLQPMMFPRRGRFDSWLVEPGPPAISTTAGTILIYNGANHPKLGDPELPPFAYQPGQALFDAADPSACIARPEDPFFAGGPDVRHGQVDNVCFAEGLVLFRDQWMLYFGMADSRIGCATSAVVR